MSLERDFSKHLFIKTQPTYYFWREGTQFRDIAVIETTTIAHSATIDTEDKPRCQNNIQFLVPYLTVRCRNSETIRF